MSYRCRVFLALVCALSAVAGIPRAQAVDGLSLTSSHQNGVAADFDGDGRVDVAVGYPGYDHERGVVTVHFGQAWNGQSRPESNPATLLTVSGNEASETVAAIDAGMHSVVLSSTDSTFTNAGLAPNPWIDFGHALAVGDFDADGRPDLVIGIPGMDLGNVLNAGGVAVLSGVALTQLKAGNNAVARIWHQGSPGVQGDPEAGDRFGHALAVGDFDGNGADDLAIGVPFEDIGTKTDAGAVHVLYGVPGVGLTAAGNELLYGDKAGIAGNSAAHDWFGASLTAGRFNGATRSGTRCWSLAVGIPGKDVIRSRTIYSNAGAVHVFYPPRYSPGSWLPALPNPYALTAGSDQILTQDSPDVEDLVEKGDLFGSQVGRRVLTNGDYLWVGVAGESLAGCPSGEGAVAELPSNAAGIHANGDSITCNRERPDFIEHGRGWIAPRHDAFGEWLQYVPNDIDLATARIMVVIHGTNGPSFNEIEGEPLTAGFRNAIKYARRQGWLALAEQENLVVITPAWEDWTFANYSYPDHGGGYRGLYGRDIRADQWLHRIVDRYARAGVGDGRFFMIGHSAGGQFTNFYASQHPARLLGAVTESAGRYVQPSTGIAWPSGLGPATTPPGETWDLSFTPSTTGLQTAIRSGLLHAVMGSDDDGRRATLNSWSSALFTAYGRRPPTCIVPNAQHASSDVYRHSILQLFPSMKNNPAFTGLAACVPPPRAR